LTKKRLDIRKEPKKGPKINTAAALGTTSGQRGTTQEIRKKKDGRPERLVSKTASVAGNRGYLVSGPHGGRLSLVVRHTMK